MERKDIVIGGILGGLISVGVLTALRMVAWKRHSGRKITLDSILKMTSDKGPPVLGPYSFGKCIFSEKEGTYLAWSST